MFPCVECKRFIRAEEQACPFCGAEQAQAEAPSARRSSLGAFALAAALIGSTACAPDGISGGDEAEPTSETNADTTTDTSATAEGESTTTDTNNSADDNDDAGVSFYAGPDIDFAPIDGCDPFAQDCPEGEKCVPYGSTGGNWDANKCVPVEGEGAAGAPCTYDGVVEATDDCDALTHCWNVKDVDGEQLGTCTPFCMGTPNDPMCEPGTSCLITNEGSVNLCLASCDPLLQDCPEQEGCYWVPPTSDFNCLFTTKDIPEGGPCGFINDCAPGHACVPEADYPGCVGSSCCGPYCDLDAPTCADGYSCVPFFGDLAPEDAENLGVCVPPPP